ncbi:epoxide hydrolase [Fusarium albosuccineum]|uniref:Epoxide hydrolase n=1 Tax=Fusarium albosuccineum TaxID=1237068 RepID=A0A8H4NYH5_9HYPO|nr:epoxide hydrolase [Fusarium albosuccineum]
MAGADQYAKLPHPVAPEANLKPYKLEIPDKEISRLHLLLDNCEIADENWENLQQDGRFGVSRDWLVKAVEQWRHSYDWRCWEAEFNWFPHYTIDVRDDDGRIYTIRFNAIFSTRQDALPILFLHGWPGSALEYLPMLKHVTKKYPDADALPYHIIVPDLVGFGFSSRPPTDKDYDYEDNARVLVKMMHLLGFTAENGGYMTQGTDLGGALAPKMGALDSSCRLTHVNILLMPPPEGTDVNADIQAGKYTEEEIEALGRVMAFQATGSAYAAIQGTRPSTCGLAIGSSPIALLAWIGEKWLQWSDPRSTPSLDHILTNVSWYWFSKCYPTSQWIYRLMVREGANAKSGWVGVQCPLGYSWFNKESIHPPQAWRESNGVVKWFRSHDEGDHFAPIEQTEVLWQDVVDMIKEFGL